MHTGAEVQFYVFLTLSLDGGEWPVHAWGRNLVTTEQEVGFWRKENCAPPPTYHTTDAPARRIVTILTIKQVISRPAKHQAHGMDHAN
jgi:hypothetical protein